jgi:hypothetical protein
LLPFLLIDSRSIGTSGFMGDPVNYFGVDAKISDELRAKLNQKEK